MVLRVVGDGGEYDRLDYGDLPLGPWGGQRVEFWASRTGTRWHGDESCTALPTQRRSEFHDQPVRGSLADRKVPSNLHCESKGRLGTYVEIARSLVRYAGDTDDAHAKLEAGDLPLTVLSRASRWTDSILRRAETEASELSECVRIERERMSGVVERCLPSLSPGGRRMAEMVSADWILSGRKPRQHEEQYTWFADGWA